MEGIIYFLVMLVIMIGGAVSSANRKKKQQQEAARKLQQRPGAEAEAQDVKQVVRKSISEILEELAGNDLNPMMPEEVNYEEEDNSYHEFEEMIPFDEGGRITTDAPNRIAETNPVELLGTEEDSDRLTVGDILGGEFDLRRAVIESEILNPKFKQY